MLKKLASVACVFALALVPVRPAAAWGEVCVEFPLWEASYDGTFIVSRVGVDPSSRSGGQSAPSGHESELIFPDGHECVDVSDIPAGEKFMVVVRPQFAPDHSTLCVPGVGNESRLAGRGEQGKGKYGAWIEPWVTKPDSNSGALWFRARGSESSPACAFSRATR